MARLTPRTSGRSVVDLTRDPMAPPELVIKAILDGVDETARQMERRWVRRAWLALDRAATDAGAEPLAPEVWECVLPSTGEVVSIVRTEAEAHHVARESEVWTLAEIAVLIERLGNQVRQVKRTFPGSAVVEVRDRDPPPIDWEKGDDPPF
jgi:hypothetical protein